jgi:hypothetical protein
MSAATRWRGHCLGCTRERDVESRPTHAMKVLCDDCAQKPHKPPSATVEDIAQTNGKTPRAAARTLTLTPASTIKSGRVRWLWNGWVPLGALTVVAGEPGLGKSILTGAHLAACITRGALAGELHGKPADVLIASAEDDWSAVILPRLMAANANLERVHRVDVSDDDGAGTFTLPDDVRRLEVALDALAAAGRTVAMLVIDPIGAFLSAGTDSHKDASVRRALTPSAQLAMDRGMAVVAVAHLTKDQSQRLMSRVSGSVAFGAAPRSVIGFARDPDDPDGEQGADRIIVHAKSNVGRYATSLTARIESRMVDTHDGLADTGFLRITGESTIGVDDLQRGRDDDGPDCEEAIGLALAGGPRPSREVKAQITAELGCSRRTVERAAVRMHGRDEIVIEKSGFPPTSTWALANGDTPLATNHHALRVANGQAPMDTGIAGNGASNGDMSPGGVANGNGHDPDAELERLQEKFPDLTETAARCRCSSPVVGVDDDGDPVCSKCGRAS